MAYSTCNTTDYLGRAILHVWTPKIGARTFAELVEGNAEKIFHLYGHGAYARSMLRDSIPFRPIFPKSRNFPMTNLRSSLTGCYCREVGVKGYPFTAAGT